MSQTAQLTRRIFNDRDFLAAMEEARIKTGLTMEEICEDAGVPDRYYNKVKMGLESEKIRDLRRQMRGREKPRSQPTVRRPFKMENSAAWMLEACGLALVVMPLKDAIDLIEPDPVSQIDQKYRERRIALQATIGVGS